MEGIRMDERLKSHIEKLFENAPKTRKAFELKEELLVNSEERYQDLLADGVSPEDACKHVISSIGNVSALFQSLEDLSIESKKNYEDRSRKIAIIKTAAVGLYILSIIIYFTFLMLGNYVFRYSITVFGYIITLLVATIPTCMLVYVNNIYPKYKKTEDTLVEDFKEWKSDSMKRKSVKNAVFWVIWTFVILIYFMVSFLTYAWYATWIIFLAGACIHAITELLFRLKELKQ
jgi:hypothetical protein